MTDDDADIEAQVESRARNEAKDIAKMLHRQLMANAAVAEVQPNIQDSEDDRLHQQEKRKEALPQC